MDKKHPTIQYLIFILIFLLIPAVSVVLSLYISGDINRLNCEVKCYAKMVH